MKFVKKDFVTFLFYIYLRSMTRKTIKHIAIAGNIGAGKTTLTGLLAKHYDWTPQYESTENNPYLSDFYNDMLRWSFNLQVYFLHHRLRQLIDIQNSALTIIQDRTIYEDAYIFAANLYDMGLMSGRDFENYSSFFQTIKSMIHAPDLLIYLRASIPTLVDQIQKRGRDYEENIRLDYLKKLNGHYEKWIAGYKDGPLFIFNCDELNFHENPEDLAFIINKIDGEINGLF